MELRNEPRLGLELKLRKVAIIASLFAVLITISVFVYTNLSSSSDTYAGVQSTTNMISGLVYCDIDQDETQDSYEANLDNVKVWLFDDANGNGSIDAGETAIDSTTTNSSGSYSFSIDYSSGGGSITLDITHKNDDAYEKSNGDIKRNNNNMKMNKDLIGLYFQDVAIPQGATITSASIELNSWNSQSGTGTVNIYADDVDNSSAIITSDDDISDRTKTTEYVTWSLGNWGYDVDYSTPDLSDVVQEITDRSNWQSGNDMTFMIYEVSGSQKKFTTTDYSSYYSPTLSVAYSSSDTGSTNNYIVRADTSSYTGSNLSGDNDLAVSFSSGGNTNANNDFGFINACGDDAKNRIVGKIFNDADKDGELDAGEGACENVKIRLHCDLDGSQTLNGGDACIDSVSTSSTGAFEFLVDYTSSSSSSTTFSKQISSNSYDAEEKSDGEMSISSSDLDLNEYTVGLLYDNVTIPQGATITNAYIKFRSEDNSPSSSASVKVYAEDVDNASTFSYTDDDITDRTKTTANVTWSIERWYTNSYYNTDDISSVIQEVINRSNWSSGNKLNIIIEPNSGSDRDAISRDNSSSSAPEIFITYTTGSAHANKFIVEIDTTSGNLDEVITDVTIPVAFTSSGNQSDEIETAGFDASALPVDLMYFNASLKNSYAELIWATAMEENNSHFEIQRSLDGQNFEKIAEEPGNGNSMNIIKYQYQDVNIPTQDDPIYYRLKQVDFDGAFEYSPIVYVKSGEEHMANVYPNPAIDFINVSKNGYRFSVKILDRNGTIVELRENEMDNTQIPVDQLPNGFYIVQIVSRTGDESHKILVKH